jgi:hypothetical protein
MLSALVAVLIQGKIPGANSFLVTAYAISNSASLGFLFISGVFCLEVVWRAFRFMNSSSKKQTKHILVAIKSTKDIVHDIRLFQLQYNQNEDIAESASATTTASEKLNPINGTFDRRESLKRQKTWNGMQDKTIVDKFYEHEGQIHHMFDERQKIINQTAELVGAGSNIGTFTRNFEKFWKDYCSIFGKLAILFFYAGSASLFVANVVFMWAAYDLYYNCPTGSYIAAIVLFLSLLLSTAVVIYLRYVDRARNVSGVYSPPVRQNMVYSHQSRPLEIPLQTKDYADSGGVRIVLEGYRRKDENV